MALYRYDPRRRKTISCKFPVIAIGRADGPLLDEKRLSDVTDGKKKADPFRADFVFYAVAENLSYFLDYLQNLGNVGINVDIADSNIFLGRKC